MSLVLILSGVPVSPARAQDVLDPAEERAVAAATVLLSALLSQSENGVTTEYKQCFLGSGTVISPDARFILTNYHVASLVDLATSHAAETEANLLAGNPGRQVTVQFAEIVVSIVDNTVGFPYRRYRAEVVEQDAGLDLALLRITGDSPGINHEEPLGRPHLPLEFGVARPGQAITLFGYPATEPSDPGCAPVPQRESIQMFPGSVSGYAENGDRLNVTAHGPEA